MEERGEVSKDQIAFLEDLLAGIFLLALAIVPIVEIILRKISGSGLLWSSGILQHFVVWIAMVGGMSASREGVHLSLSSDRRPQYNFWKCIEKIKNMAATAINTAFAVSSASFLLLGFGPDDRLGILPIRLILLILPIAYLSMALRALWRPKKRPSRLLFWGLLIGVFFSWPAVVNILSTISFDLPSWFFVSVDYWYMMFRWLRWFLIIGIIFLGLRGLPIYLMLGGTALFLFAGNWGALESLPNEAYNLLIENMIPAIPLFTIAGFLLSESSAGKRLIRFFRAALGWLPGGLAVVAVVACAFFTTFTGASGVTILALGGVLTALLIKGGEYGKDFSYGLVTSSGSVGLLFPPALPIIMYGVTAQISIKDMFLGGILPGGLLVLALSAMGVYRALKLKKKPVLFNFKELRLSLWAALGTLVLPLILLVSYFGGLTNIIETAALAVLYIIVLMTVTKELTLPLIVKVLRRGIPVIGGVLIILVMARGLRYFIVDAQVPTLLTAFFREYISSPLVFLILLNVALLITGTLMDIYSAIFVVAPLIVPLGALYGVHPVQLGIIFLANLQLGYLTPPVGMNLFLASYTFNEPLSKVYRQIVPFLLVLAVVVLLITYVPWFSLAFIQTP